VYPAPKATVTDESLALDLQSLRLREHRMAADTLQVLAALPSGDGTALEPALRQPLHRSFDPHGRSARAWLAAQWTGRMGATRELKRAQQTLSEDASMLLSQLLEPPVPASSTIGRFAVTLQVGDQPPRRIPGAVVVSASSADASPLRSERPVLLLLPTLGIIECQPDHLPKILDYASDHLHQNLFAQMPADHLQPAAGGSAALSFAFPARRQTDVGEAVVDELIEGHLQISRYLRERAQPQPVLSDTLGAALAGPGRGDRIVAQLATLGLLPTPLQHPGHTLELVRAWPHYLHALRHEVAVGGAVPPMEYRTSEQLSRHANGVLRQSLQEQLGRELDPDDIRVRWTRSTLSWDNGHLPDTEVDAAFIRREGAGLETHEDLDFSLTELAIRNVALFDTDYVAGARVTDAAGKPIAGLDGSAVRALVRRVDVASAYQAHLTEQFDPAPAGGAGHQRLEAFRHVLPARLRLDLALHRVAGSGAPPRLLNQWLADSHRRTVDHQGRNMAWVIGALQLTHSMPNSEGQLGPSVYSVPMMGEQETVPGTLVMSAGGTTEVYVPGLQPDPFLVFNAPEALHRWLAEPAVRALLLGRLHNAVVRDAIDSGHLSRIQASVSTGEGDDPVQSHYVRAWKHLHAEADALSTSTGEQQLEDAWTCVVAAFEVAENFLPARLQLLSAMVRSGISGSRLFDGRSVTPMQRTGAWVAAVMDVIDVAGNGPSAAARPGRLLHDPRLPLTTSAKVRGDGAGTVRFLDTDSGRVRVAVSSSDADHAAVAILDPLHGAPSGGRVVWDPAAGSWRIEAGSVLDDTTVTSFSADVTDAQLARMSTQGTGVFDVDQRQYVRVGGRWYESEVRPELDGGRYIKAPGGQIQLQLPLARQAGQWVIVHRPTGGLAGGGRRSAVGPRADMRDDAPAGRWIDDAQLDELAAIHGAHSTDAFSVALRHDLRIAARQAFLKRVADGNAMIDDEVQGRLAMLCAFAADPQLSGGYRIDLNVRNRGVETIRIGSGPGASMAFDVDNELPSMTALIDAAGPHNLRRLLALDGQATSAQVQQALRQRLAATVASQHEAVSGLWEGALRRYEQAPRAVATLTQQTGLDATEARDLLARYPEYADDDVPSEAREALQARTVAVQAETQQRSARREVVSGRIVTSDGLQALLPALSTAFDGQVLRAGVSASGVPQLHIQTPFLQHTLTFDVGGVTLEGATGRRWATWQDAIQAVSGSSARSPLQTAETLRDDALAELARTPLQASPALRSRGVATGDSAACGGGRISRRAPCVASRSKPDAATSARWDVLRDRASTLRTAAKREVERRLAAPGKPAALRLAQAQQAALLRSNIMVFDVDVHVGGQRIHFEKTYVSHATLSNAFGFAASDLKALKVVVPATYRGAGPEPRHGMPLASDYMARDDDFDAVRKEEFPFGRDYLKPTLGARYDRNEVTLHRFGEEGAQAGTAARLRQQLIDEGFDPATVARLQPGDAYYRTRATRCTEVQALQELAQRIGALGKGGIDPTVHGRIVAFTDMPPCDRNCQRLLREAARLLPNVDIKVASGDPTKAGVIPVHTKKPKWFEMK